MKWSNPFCFLSNVKCFSITFAPLATAAIQMLNYPEYGPNNLQYN